MSRGGERLQRVEVRAPGAAAGASVWAARCESPEGPAFVLRHDYPDLKPARGWEAGPDVASNNKTLDLTGTGSQELEYLFVFG